MASQDFSELDILEDTRINEANRREPVTFDKVLLVLGEFGHFQKLLYFMFSLPYVETAMQLLGWVFVGATPGHKCPSDNSTTNQTSGYDFDTTHVMSSVVMEWHLVCNRSGLHATVGAAPMVGYLVGALIFGTLSDKVGRKPTFLIANLILLLSGLCGSIAPSYVTFVASRFLVGMSIAGVESSCFVMGMELVGPSKRTLAGILCWFFETAGLMLAVGLAYVFRDNWRLLQTMYSLPAAFFFLYAWTAPESVRWLLTRHRIKEAERVIRMTAKWNGTANELPEEMMAQLISDCEEEAGKGNKTNTVLDLFRTFNLRVKTLVLAYAWTVCSALYYVLLLDQSELSSDPYLGFVVTAAVQLPGYLYVIFTLERPFFGRKRSMCAFLVLSGLCLCIHPCISGRSQPMLKVAVSIFGRFCANCSYTILNLFSAEQFPTVVRGVGVGFTLVVSRFGTILAPYILLLGPHAPILFGIAAVSAGLVSLVLPETLGHPLPETIEDGEARGLATFPLIKTIFST